MYMYITLGFYVNATILSTQWCSLIRNQLLQINCLINYTHTCTLINIVYFQTSAYIHVHVHVTHD